MTLRSRLTRLAHDNPELRADLLPLLKQARLRFRPQTITLNLKGGKRVKVDAEVVGSWAVHLDTPPPEPPNQPGWVVTFIPTSQRLVWERSKTDAKRALERVFKAVPEAREAKTVSELMEHSDAISRAL